MSGERPAIVLVTNVYLPAIGGITTYVKGLKESLSKRGYSVHIISYPYLMIRREDKMPDGFRRQFVHELLVFAFTVYALARILALKLKGREVIVHSQSASFCLGISVLARLIGARSVHTFHSPIDRCSLRLRVLIPFANSLVCVSDEQRNQYVERCGIPRDSSVVPGGTDCNFFAPDPEERRSDLRVELMRELGLDDRPGPLVLFVGRIVKEKGVDVLLQSAKSISKEFKDATFVLIGPHDQTKEYADDAKALMEGVDPGLRFFLAGTQNHERLRRAYNAADVLAFPSLWEEASPIVVVEAMASGLPVVASRIGGLKSRVVEGVTGHLTEPGNASELAGGILDILRNPSKRLEMGRASRKLAVEKYSLHVTADKYEEIYRRVMGF